MTERLYYTDAYLREFTARVVDRSGDATRVYFDRTAFYPTSGGQPRDKGELNGIEVIDVVDEGERVAHVFEAPFTAQEINGRIDWPRRWDHMQQHTGQHLLSAVFAEALGATTVSVHFGADQSTLDLDTQSLSHEQILTIEARANHVVQETRPVSISFADSGTASGLRKASAREGSLRIVTIDGLDQSACGGTHVRATGEIGLILISGVEKVRKTLRVEFLCGVRASVRARRAFDSLDEIARMLSTQHDEAPALVRGKLAEIESLTKAEGKLLLELMTAKSAELHAITAPDELGMRRVVQVGTAKNLRLLAQRFTTQPKTIFIGIVDDPPGLLMATSPDTDIDAGERLKAALNAVGGRGGGNARFAQGSVPSASQAAKTAELL